MTMTTTAIILFTISLGILGWQDYRTNLIHSYWLVPAVCCINWFTGRPWIILCIYLLLIYINTRLQERFIGHGDLDVLFVALLLLPSQTWLRWIIVACALTLLSARLWRDRDIPFVCCLTCAWPIIFI